MSEARTMLAEFHRAFAHPDTDALWLRPTLHQEEHDELVEALQAGDREAIARELADVLYIAYGTAHVYGIDLDVALREVHRANMSKLPDCDHCRGRGYIPRVSGSSTLCCSNCDGSGKLAPVRRDDGKVLKGDGFRPPNMATAIAAKRSSEQRADTPETPPLGEEQN